MIKDEILVYNKLSSTKQRCFSCNALGHDITNCGKINYLPIRDFVISRSQFSKAQERDHRFQRKKRGKFNSRLKNALVIDQARELLNNISIIDSDSSLNISIEPEKERERSAEQFEGVGESSSQNMIPLTSGRKDQNDLCIEENEEYEVDSDILKETSAYLNMRGIKISTPRILDDLISPRTEADPLLSRRDYNPITKEARSNSSFLKVELDRNNSYDKKQRASDNKHTLDIKEINRLSSKKTVSKMGNSIAIMQQVADSGPELGDKISPKDIKKTLSSRKEKKNIVKMISDGPNFLSSKSVSLLNSSVSRNTIINNHQEDSITGTDSKSKQRGYKISGEENKSYQEGSLYFFEFERAQSYARYFNNNNLENVLTEIKEKDKIAKKKKQKMMQNKRIFINFEDFSPGGKSSIKNREGFSPSSRRLVKKAGDSSAGLSNPLWNIGNLSPKSNFRLKKRESKFPLKNDYSENSKVENFKIYELVQDEESIKR